MSTECGNGVIEDMKTILFKVRVYVYLWMLFKLFLVVEPKDVAL